MQHIYPLTDFDLVYKHSFCKLAMLLKFKLPNLFCLIVLTPYKSSALVIIGELRCT